jgi:Fe-S-cluster containining protein
MKNTILAKARRTLTSVLPVSKDRRGECIDCGECCKLPTKCLFLRHKADGSSYCLAYKFRPFNCRKYPRTKSEFLTADTCGFRFEEKPQILGTRPAKP